MVEVAIMEVINMACVSDASLANHADSRTIDDRIFIIGFVHMSEIDSRC
jgi:hypothetical protein